MCVVGARAFTVGGGCGCLLVAGGAIGIRLEIQWGGDGLNGLLREGQPTQPSYILWQAHEVEETNNRSWMQI
jgi:hypothetical protein